MGWFDYKPRSIDNAPALSFIAHKTAGGFDYCGGNYDNGDMGETMADWACSGRYSRFECKNDQGRVYRYSAEELRK